MSNLEQQREAEKTRLVDTFFGITATYRIKEIRAVERELKTFAKDYGSDRQVDDLLTLIKITEMSRKNYDFEKRCLLAKPILQRVDELGTWELTDLRILAVAAFATMDFTLFLRLFDRALTLLKTDYAKAPFYEKATFVLYHNSTAVLLQLYHLSLEESDQLHKQVKALLTKHLDIAYKRLLVLRDTDKIYQCFYGMCLVRKGLFTEDERLVEKGIAVVKKHGEQAALRLIQEEKEAYEFVVYQTVGMSIFLKQLGANVRRHRKLQKLTMEELADLANIHPNTVSNIEQAEQATSIFILLKISKALGVSADELMFGSIEQQTEAASNPVRDLLRLSSRLDEEHVKTLLDHANYLSFTQNNKALQEQ